MKALWSMVAISGLTFVAAGCNAAKDATQAQTQASRQLPSVDVAIAKKGSLTASKEYTGTTAPIREVSVRSRIEGRLLDLGVDVGDRVEAGQVIAQLDDATLSASVLQADAEVAARESEVSQANAAVGNARAQVERARLEYQQAQVDADRFQKLAKEGAVSPQTAETASTRAQTLAQAVRSAEQQVKLQEQTVGASSQRVLAQEAIRLREQERQSYTAIAAPISGLVLERLSETGSLLFAGNEVVRVGDFSQVKVIVLVSELEISNVRVNQSVDVQFDMLPNQKFKGRVLRISPVADTVARLIPVEVAVPNRDNRLGSGMLARVSFGDRSNQPQIVIAETALEAMGRSGAGRPNASQDSGKPKGRDRAQPQTGNVFVMTGNDQEPKVTKRQVTIGDRRDGKVSIISGLKEGDRVVIRSSGKLQDGDTVKLSILSET
ncbi:MAG: efflux RND transporter periplasmic adaptor subunit [Pseudanabaenaceae cyanobacterium bins.39]|nr:efflux RND transporter periplasmic adaptor subunit [Pseudanabaenaceae cyanobacterium bins.39]